MMPNAGIRNVGAIDPELQSSPVVEEMEEDAYTLRQQVADQAVCFFNGEVFRDGEFVRSGTMMLKCSKGLWIEAGSADPRNP
jgi:hypothetical protein